MYNFLYGISIFKLNYILWEEPPEKVKCWDDIHFVFSQFVPRIIYRQLSNVMDIIWEGIALLYCPYFL